MEKFIGEINMENKRVIINEKGEEVTIIDEGNVRTFIYPNAIVRVQFADISDEENERRMKRIEQAAIAVMKDKLAREARKKKNEAHTE